MTTALSRPANPQANVDSNPLECLSEGINYPTFRLLNKKSRVTLSPNYLSSDPAFNYQNFAVANKKGWFAAIQNTGPFSIILSPLNQLRNSIKECSGDETHFQPQRVLSFSNNEPNIVAFACNDSRLIVGFKSGELLSYDTAAICSQGSNEVSPLKFAKHSSSPPTQILPNHSSDPALADLVAVVRKDGNVELFNTTLEKQHGWSPGDANSTPVVVSWSAKGKQLAIGLALGDIMTYPLTNKNAYQRHIPPTADGILVSLDWLAPGHTFRTSYSPPTPGSDDPVHHILHQDAKSSPVQFTKMDHSFQAPDRTKQSSYVVVLPKWDEDATNSNADESKLLVVVGDVSCTDIEILGNQGTQWYQQSQDNPVSIPLDKNTEDTVLLALDVDLTDSEAGYPVVYAYLNDGTVQAWYVDGSKPYAGMINGATGASNTSATTPSAFGEASTQPTSVFGQTPAPQATSPFGQAAGSSPSPFGAPSSSGSAFGQSSFGQSSSTPSPFGASNQPSPFGQQTSAFGSQTQPTSPFGGTSQQASPFGSTQSTSAFGTQSSSQSPFGSQPQSTSAFGGGSTFGQSGFGQSAFGQSGFGDKAPSPFGSASSTTPSSTGGPFSAFGSAATPSPFGGSFGAPAPGASSPPITRDDSMGESAPSFGGMSLGSGDGDPEKKPSGFGAGGGMFGNAANQSTTSAFGSGSSDSGSGGGLVKPASGFGAFGGASSGAFGSTTSAFGGGGAFSGKSDQPATGAFSGGAFSTNTASSGATTGGSAFGQSSFGQSSFGKPAFGQGAFGQSGFGQSAFSKPSTPPPTTTSSGSGGGFAAFASAGTSSFGSGTGGAKAGFGGDTGGTSGAFGGAKSETSGVFGDKTAETKPSSGFGAFSGQPSAFGSTASAGSAFGSKPTETPSASEGKTDTKPALGFGAFANQPSTFGATASPGSFGGSAFGNASPGQSAFGTTTSAFAPRSDSSTSAPKPAGLADPLSPSPSPSPPPIAPIPTSSSTAPTSGTGAFSNLTRSSFRPDSGFGAFGSAVSSDSPFLKAAGENKEPAVTAFGSTNPTAQSSSDSRSSTASPSPAFGSTSQLGFGFGLKGSAPVTPTASTSAFGSTAPATGAFSAFSSGGTSAFGSLTAGKKSATSFGDLLKGAGDESKKEDIGEKPKEEAKEQEKEASGDKEKGKQKESPVERSVTPKTEDEHATPKPPPPKALKEEEKSPSVFGSSVFKPPEKPPSNEPPTPPADDASSSQASSYVDVRRSEAGSEEGSDVEAPPDDDEGFLTESYGSQSEGEELSEGEVDERASLTPSNIPLPRSRSGTPLAETSAQPSSSSEEPEAYDDDYVDEEDEDEEDEDEEETDDDTTSESSRLSTIKEENETMTPPGSPEKKDTRPSATASPAPASSSPSPLLSVGRPSTRPSRSSPLAASAPLSGYDEEADATTPTTKEQPQLPSVVKPRPSSPKMPFGVLQPQAPKPIAPEDANPAKRPKTPPLLSNFGLGGSSASSKPSLFGQPSAPPTSLFGAPSSSSATPALSPAASTPPPRANTAPPAPRGLFSATTPTPRSVPLTPGTSASPVPPAAPSPVAPGGLFGKPPPISFGLPSPASVPIKKEDITPPPGSLFLTTPARPMTMPPPSALPASQPPAATISPFPSGNMFGTPTGTNQRPPVPFNAPVAQPAQPIQPPQPVVPSPMQFQEGMQRECALLYTNMMRELEQLRLMAESAAQKREEIRKMGGGSRRKEDLGDASKWGLGDVVQMGVVMRQYEKDIHELKEETQKQKRSIGELNKSMVKAGTRREEIARFNKAKSDNEFAKMLKSRTLGPEHLETQTQLRRNIRTLSTRVEQLEDQLKAHKKKIAEYNSGRPSLRAPTIDTVNRTYRNIDIAIQQQADDLARLTSRVKKLNLSDSPLPLQKSSLGDRDPRLPDPVRRPFTVTPDVAVTTAAALNAERYAHKLKTALLSARKEPLLNATAAKAMTTSDVPVAFSTPGRKPMGSNGFEFNTPIQGPLFGVPPTAEIPDTNYFPEDHFNPSTPSGSSRRGGGSSRRSHAPAVTLRRSPAATAVLPDGAGLGSPPVGFGSPSPAPNLPASPSPAFDWGPLPSFNKASSPSLFAPISFGNKGGSSGKS